jgi:hypothetical protein
MGRQASVKSCGTWWALVMGGGGGGGGGRPAPPPPPAQTLNESYAVTALLTGAAYPRPSFL